MLEIAAEYVAKQGDRHLAAVEFTRALMAGSAWSADIPGHYSAENAILATIAAFELTQLETIRLVAGLLGSSLGDRPAVTKYEKAVESAFHSQHDDAAALAEAERRADMLQDDDGSGVVDEA